MKVLPVFIFLLFPILIPQHKSWQPAENGWTKAELLMANTASNASYLTSEEKDIIYYMNLARIDGEKFFKTYFQDFIAAYDQNMRQYSNYNALKISKGNSYYRSLEKDLKNIKNLPMLYPDEALSLVSKAHAKDMNRNNFTGHNSSNGRTVRDRIGKIYPKRSNGENLAFGYATGLDNVCILLLDKDVPDLGHRKIILDKDYKLKYVGVSIHPHKKYKYCTVIDFVAP